MLQYDVCVVCERKIDTSSTTKILQAPDTKKYNNPLIPLLI